MAKKRANGEGNIRKRKDGRWEGRYTAGIDPETGKPIAKSVLARTQRECKEKLQKAMEELEKIDVTKRRDYTVGEWAQLWYENYAKPSVRASTAAYYKNYIDQHIVPRIGNIKLTALTTLQIQKFYNETKAHGRVQRYENMDDLSLSNKTIRGLHTMLRQCLGQAVTERLIPYNPANGCRLPKKEKKKMQIIPPEKIRDYLKAAEEWGVLPMFYLELSTGLRRGELVALLRSDLNLQTKTLTVSKSVSRGKGELVVTEPKTENSVREIYISDEAIRLLVEDRKNHPFSPYMFPSPKTGGMYGPDCVGRIHKKLLEKAGIEIQRQNVAGQNVLQECHLVGTLNIDTAHVGDVEDAAVTATVEMLCDDAFRVLDGHIPAAKVDHCRACVEMCLIQNRPFQFAHSFLLMI